MLFAFVLAAGLAYGVDLGDPNTVRVDWTYYQDTATPNVDGTLSDIEILADLVGGNSGTPDFDPNVFLTATLPRPVFTAFEDPNVSAGAVAAIQYDEGIDMGAQGYGIGFSMQWSGNAVYSVRVNYDGGDEEIWALPVPLIFYSDDDDDDCDPTVETGYEWAMNLYDIAGDDDATGVFRTCSKWGDGPEGGRHKGDPKTWASGAETHYEEHVGKCRSTGRRSNGDDMGVLIFLMNDGSGIIYVDDVTLGGTLFADLLDLELVAESCPELAIKDVADINGDCKVNLQDLALLAATWQECGFDYGGCL